MTELTELLENSTESAGDEASLTPEPQEIPEAQPEPEKVAEVEDEPVAEEQPKTVSMEQYEALQKQVNGLKSAASAEREKRQKLEVQQMATPKQEQAESVDPLENPDAFIQKIQQDMLRQRFDMSRNLMANLKEDYHEMEAIFLENADQSLQEQVKASDNPAGFMYETAKSYSMMQEIGDPATYRENLKAELLAEIQQEQSQNKEALTQGLTPSLAKTSSSGSVSGSTWSGPTPITNLLNN